MEHTIQLHIEKLPEGVYLATSDEVQGLIAQGRTIQATIEIAHDVAKKLIEAQSGKNATPPAMARKVFDYPLLNQILSIVYSIKEDKEKLTKLLHFMEEEFVEEEEIELDCYDYKQKLPEKYRGIVKQIANNLSANLLSFFNPDTLELEDVPKDLLDKMLFDEDDEESDEENPFDLQHHKWDKCIEIEPLESRESFEIMANFVNQLKNGRETNQLSQALNGRKPFANFNRVIHNSKYREDWFAFKQKELEKYVIRNYFAEYMDKDFTSGV
jgi:predicted RNase H-like HicB family nuclease